VTEFVCGLQLVDILNISVTLALLLYPGLLPHSLGNILISNSSFAKAGNYSATSNSSLYAYMLWISRRGM